MMLFKRLMLVIVWLVVLGIDWTAHSVTAQGMGSLIVYLAFSIYTSTTTDWVWVHKYDDSS